MWIYKNKLINSIKDLPDWENLFGFTYIIKNLENNRYYIGKKNFYSTLTKKLSKKELKEITDKRLKTYKKITKESNWKDYWGTVTSNMDYMKELQNSKKNFAKEIISLAYSKKELTFLELEEQINHNVLRDDLSYNNNILGKWFRKDLKY